MKHKRQQIESGGLLIGFVPSSSGGLKNSYIRFEYKGEYINFSDDKRILKRLKKMLELTLRGRK
mgnify:CR=1 FL=1